MSEGPPSQQATLFIRCSENSIYIKPTLLTVAKKENLTVINQLEERDVTLRIPHMGIREVIEAGTRKGLSIRDQPLGLYPYLVSSGDQSVSGTIVVHS